MRNPDRIDSLKYKYIIKKKNKLHIFFTLKLSLYTI